MENATCPVPSVSRRRISGSSAVPMKLGDSSNSYQVLYCACSENRENNSNIDHVYETEEEYKEYTVIPGLVYREVYRLCRKSCSVIDSRVIKLVEKPC